MQAGIRCELISWERFHALARRLAFAVRQSGFEPELLVAIGRGGYMPARIVSDYLDLFDLSAIKIEHYHGVHKERVARVRYPLAADIAGKRVLLIDDVSDSGDTFDVALRHLRECGTPAALKTAVLHHKTVASFTPDYAAELVREWRWIIYPWAIMEDLRSFLRDMDPQPASVGDFACRLHERHGIEVDEQTLRDLLATSAGAGGAGRL